MNLKIDFSTKMMKWSKGVTKDFEFGILIGIMITNSTEFSSTTKSLLMFQMNMKKFIEKVLEFMNI